MERGGAAAVRHPPVRAHTPSPGRTRAGDKANAAPSVDGGADNLAIKEDVHRVSAGPTEVQILALIGEQAAASTRCPICFGISVPVADARTAGETASHDALAHMRKTIWVSLRRVSR